MIFETYASEICAAPGPNVGVFEYGAGASEKIEWLINGLQQPAGYIAMDISRDYLIESASLIAQAQSLPVAAICADFNFDVEIPVSNFPKPDRWLGYFPGSTIGNLTPDAAIELLGRAANTLGENAHFLLGVDLEKDISVLNAAYNDSAGVTAAFNLNVLRRMTTEIGAIIAPSDFDHHAFYNPRDGRIEMHLRANKPTSIEIQGRKFHFQAQESLHTENSYKYSKDRLNVLIDQTPWRLEKMWTDDREWFAVCLLSRN